MPSLASPEALLEDLNEAQLEAVRAVEGPVAIIAGAGTGKTRVISRRAAHAIATGIAPADQVLVVTFTEKAAGEMMERLRVLGLPGVTARTFHAHALSQLRFFWPLANEGARLPVLLDSKLPLLVPIVRRLPGHYRFTPAKDIADEIEWAKSRRIAPGTYATAADAAGREPPVPLDLFARAFADYERAKDRAGRLDFDDLLVRTVELLETNAEAAAMVHARKRWFSVDEYQDTNPLQERLLELWAGDSRDICVVGDEDQTIYTFTGATSRFLTTFAERHAGAQVIALVENYRSSPQVLAIANRLLAGAGSAKQLVATRPSGPEPTVTAHATGDAESAWLADEIRELIAAGTEPAEIAILVRMNAQLADLEAALTRAAIAYRVRGQGFYRRPDVRAAIDLLRRTGDATGPALAAAARKAWTAGLGWEEGAEPDGAEARERAASLETLAGMIDDLVAADPQVDADAVRAELDRRAAAEQAASETGAGGGVELVTYHRAKGLEWDAVFLPMLEEGALPIRQAWDSDEALDEERRLLYVGITRARRHLALSWAEQRETRGRDSRRRMSRFLVGLTGPPRPTTGRHQRRAMPRVVELGDAFAKPARQTDSPLLGALKAWRVERSRSDGAPAFVVAHDSTLQAIAEVRPTTLAALRRVKGMGPMKLERYGPEILQVIEQASGMDRDVE
ncbi:MAG TPA: ATP-dependent DNA helicase UvrD2 [Candidatus Limnocylindrales bacterium]